MTIKTKISFLGGNNYSRIGGNSILFETSRNNLVFSRFLIDFGALFLNKDNREFKITPNIIKYLDYCPSKKEKSGALFKYYKKEKDALAQKEGYTSLDGIFLTHIHEDHIGGIALLIKAGFLFPPIFASKETLSILGRILIESNVPEMPELIPINGPVQLNEATILTPFRVAHSAVGSFGYHILTKEDEKPIAGILAMGDYNFSTPLLSKQSALNDVLKDKFITHILADSTSSNNPSLTPVSFQEAVSNYEEILKTSDKRIISATISRSLENMAPILMASKQTGRKVFIDGVMQRFVYDELKNQNKLDVFESTVFNHEDVTKGDIKTFLSHVPLKKQVIILSGAFAEGLNNKENTHRSGLVRLATKTHAGLKIGPDDLIILGQRAIPVKNILQDMRKMTQELGALNNNQIIQNETGKDFSLGPFEMRRLQRTGHATFFETLTLLKTVLKERKNKEDGLTLLPVHGDITQLNNTRKIAQESGINSLLLKNGESLLISPEKEEVQKEESPVYLAFQEEENTGRTNLFLTMMLCKIQKQETDIFVEIKDLLLNSSLLITEGRHKNKLIQFHRMNLLKRERE